MIIMCVSEDRQRSRRCRQCCQFAGLLQVLGRLFHALLQALIGLKHVFFKLLALKCSMRLNIEAFKIGTLRRQEMGRILNFKCL